MASIDIRNSDNIDNMLQSLTKTAYNSILYRNVLHKIKPVLCTVSTNNFHTTPIVSKSDSKKDSKKPSGKYAKPEDFPNYPVPELEDTLSKYLRSLMPILSAEELHNTKCLVEDFGKKAGCGEALQKQLKQRSKCMKNWLAQWWMEAAYLGFRSPVVVFSSPGQLMLPIQNFCDPGSRLSYAAKLITCALQYKKLIDTEALPQERAGKDPLDMGQYKVLFGTCRMPKPFLDGIQYNPKSKHLIVCVNNNFFKMTPYDKCGEILPLSQIQKQLECIMKLSCEKAPAIGILTSDLRDVWATNYQLLMKDEQNQESVCEIQKSMFLLCLDEKLPKHEEKDRISFAGMHCIHGYGSKKSGGNRWFDKTLQFTITEDGIVGLTYEHTPAEGVPVAVLVDYIAKNINQIKSNPCGKKAEEAAPVKKLEFNVDCDLQTAIKASAKALDNLMCDLDMEGAVFKDYGKNFIKSQKLSPDAYIQMAMQLAYYRMYCKVAVHYESAACRKYVGGRTETIRTLSVESRKFCEGFLDPNIKPMDKRHLLEAAIKAHQKYTVDAVSGFGIDRHFLGLKRIAEEFNIALHPMFEDEAFSKSTYYKITSSQVPTKGPGFMCYGAVVPDGYGICYNPRDDDIYYAVSCFNAEVSTDARKMKTALEMSFKDMKDILTKAPKAKA